MNALVAVCVGGSLLFAERLWHRPGGVVTTVGIEAAILAVTGTLTTWAHRQAVSAAARWGEPVRAAFDMHRLELYAKLGLRTPRSQTEEEENARAVGRLATFGEKLPDAVRASTSDAAADAP